MDNKKLDSLAGAQKIATSSKNVLAYTQEKESS